MELKFGDCVRLLKECIDRGIMLAVPGNENNVICYYEETSENPEGWYSVSIFEAAQDLFKNKSGQNLLLSLLETEGIEFIPSKAC
jgi:hypothetical protein